MVRCVLGIDMDRASLTPKLVDRADHLREVKGGAPLRECMLVVILRVLDVPQAIVDRLARVQIPRILVIQNARPSFGKLPSVERRWLPVSENKTLLLGYEFVNQRFGQLGIEWRTQRC